MREGLRGLTTRGKSLLACAVTVALAALAFGEKDLLRVAVLIGVLPLLASWYVGRTRYKLACTRSLEPTRTPVGATARVVLRLQNLSALPTGTLLLEDRLPYALGSRPRLVLERLGRRQASSVAYSVRADVRGRYEIGPLVIRLTDPFGLCELARAFPSVDKLTVTPTVVPLPAVRLTGEYTGTGDSRARSVAVHGEDDAAPREYRHGDDLRRVHWRSTARVGELMRRRSDSGLIIAVLGSLSPGDAEVVARWRGTSGTAVGFLIDSTTWLTLPPGDRAEADRARAAAALRLLRANWRTLGVAH